MSPYEQPSFRTMKTPNLHLLAATILPSALLLIPLALLVGCAGPTAQLTEEARVNLGTVAVQSARFTTQTEVAVPLTPGQAAASVALQLGLSLALTGDMAGVLLMPVGVVVGGVVGGVQGTPKKATEAAETALLKACAELDFQETVRRDVATAIRKNTRHPVAQAAKPGTKSLPHAHSLLEINVLTAGLSGSQFRDANLSLFLRVQARLMSMPGGAVLYEHTWLHTSGDRTFNEWAVHDARPFRGELSIASRAVAKSIIREIFLAQPPRKGDPFTRSLHSDKRWFEPGAWAGN